MKDSHLERVAMKTEEYDEKKNGNRFTFRQTQNLATPFPRLPLNFNNLEEVINALQRRLQRMIYNFPQEYKKKNYLLPKKI